MSRGPSLTIGLPVYNGEQYLSQALESILGQSYRDFELLVSDNASTDRTREICLDFAAMDRRLRYVRNTSNLGAAENYNRVFRASGSKYFKWATHDDMYAPTFLERCVAVLESDPSAVLCFAPAIFIDEEGNEIDRYADELDFAHPNRYRRFRSWVLERSVGWCHPITGVIRSDVLGRTRLIGKYVGSDGVLIAELALWGGLARVDEFLFYRREHAGRSAAVNRTVEDLTAWYDSSAPRGRIYLPNWRWGAEYTKALLRVPMPLREKLACSRVMLRWYAWQRVRLSREMSRWLNHSIVSRPGRRRGGEENATHGQRS